MNQPKIPPGRWGISPRLKSLGKRPPTRTEAGPGSDPDTALSAALTWLAEATGDASGSDADAVWQRVAAGIAVERRSEGVKERTRERGIVLSFRHSLVSSSLPWRAPALAAVLLVGVLGWLAGTRSLLMKPTAPRVVDVRVDSTLWDTDGLAREPAEHAIDAMNRVLKP